MPTIKDVATLVGVSESTVSLVVNNKPGIKEETRAKVLAAVKFLNYTPNHAARSLATNKTFTIGLIITDIENPFFGKLSKYFYETTKNKEYSLIFSISNDDLETEDKIIYDFISRSVDGLIIVPTSEIRKDFSSLTALKSSNIPFVFSTSYYPGFEWDCVMTNLSDGSYKLARYLLDLQHRDIVILVSDNLETPTAKLRIQGYEKAFSEKGLPIPCENIVECSRPDFDTAYTTAKSILEKRKPDAIITINDFMALGVEKAIHETGLSIPGDISVAGYDDVVFSSISQIPLTTIRQDIPRICNETYNTLFRETREASPIVKQIIETDLIVRESTGIRKLSNSLQKKTVNNQ